jgi:thymidylate kinase
LNRDVIAGVLIEGVDYSGKSSVADKLERLLHSRGIGFVRRACFLNTHPVIAALLELAKASNDMEFRDVCYTSCLLHDLCLPALPRPPGYLVQERHVLTQIGRNSFFYDDPQRWQIPLMQGLRPRFGCQIYLWSNMDAKRSRTRTRPPKSPRDALLASDIMLHQRYDDAMRSMLPTGEDWLVIDTSSLTPEAVAERILEKIDALDHVDAHVNT